MSKPYGNCYNILSSLAPLLAYLPESEQALRLGLSDIQLLMCDYPVFIITQKDILLNFGMNLYSGDIGRAALFSWDKSSWLKWGI
jgi:hypothetical protein